MKKIFTYLVMLVLSFCMINKVFAASNGSITINDATTDKTYEIYKIFNLTYSGTKVSYTIDNDWKEFFQNEGSIYIVDENSGSLNSINVDNDIKYINITEDNIADFAQDTLDYAAKNNLDANDTKTATSEVVEFKNLDLGYYLVYPRGATEIEDGHKSICSLTSTLPNVEIEIKSTYPVITKEVDSNTHEVGTYAMFTIKGRVPDTTGYTKYKYQINDSWTLGLELNKDKVDFKVTIDGVLVTDIEPTYNSDNKGFTLEFDMTKYQNVVGKDVVVTYNLLVTKDAVDSTTTNNKAYLTYSNDPKSNTTFDTTPIEVPVYSAKIEVLKVDGEDNEVKLSGAEFVLQNKEGNYYKILTTVDTHVTSFEWTTNIEDATIFISNEEGIAVNDLITSFEGLKDGTYYLIETKAPDGYNKLSDPIEVKLLGTTNDDDRVVPVSQNLTVENNYGLELPSTGGIGTTIFIIVGLLLTTISVIILITNKRMSKEK